MLYRLRLLRQPSFPAGGASALHAIARWGGVLLVLCALAGLRPAHAQNAANGAAGIAALGGNGLAFNGSDGVVTVSSSAFTTLPASFTIEFWAKRSQAGRQDFMVRHGGTQTANRYLHVGFRDTNTFTFAFWGNDLDTPVYTDLNWHHWAVTYDGTTRARTIYRDGVPVASDIATGAYAGGGTLRFGDASLLGQLDEVRVWNNARTAQQVRDSRSLVLPATSTGLIGYWDFETVSTLLGGTRTTVDRSATGATGTVTGGVTLTPSTYAPPAVRATYDLYENRVVLVWNTSPSTTARYQIRRDGLLLTTLSAADSTYTDLAGIAGRSYPYCVTRQDGTAFTDLGCDDGRRQLLAATGVAASDGAFTDRIRVTWTDRSAINTGYKVYRAGTLVATLGDVGSYDDTDTASLTQGTPYTYCVAAIQGAGEGAQVCDPGTRGSVLPPATVMATDGTVAGATRITWAAPAGGDPTTGNPAGAIYQLTRNGRALMGGYGVFTYLDPLEGDPVPPVAGVTYSYCVTRQLPGGAESVPTCDNGGFGTLPAATGVAASDSTRDDRVDVRWSGVGGASDGTRVTRSGGYGLTFDGVDDGVQVPMLTQTFPQFSVEAWMKVETQTSGVGFIPIIYKGLLDKGQQNIEGFALMSDPANGGRNVSLWVSGTFQTYAFADIGWHHVAATYNGTTARLYVDGVEKLSFAATLVPNSAPIMMGIGKSDNGELVGKFKGGLDEVRFWSTARTQAQVRAGMYTAITGAEDGLVSLYHFDEGIGTLATDARGGRHGRLAGFNGTATSGWAKAAAPVAGQGIRPALTLDGTTGYATATGLTALPSSFTIEFWAKRTAAGRGDFAIGQGVSTTNNGLNIGFRDNNHFILSFVGNDLDTPLAYSDLGWHHWAVTYDRATGKRTIVRDGALVASDVAASPYNGTGTLRIGQSTGNGANGLFGGALSDVRVWSRVRSAAAIAANRFALADSARAGLVAAWAFDGLDPAGTTAMTTAPGTSAGGSVNGAVLTGGATLVPGRPMLLATLPSGATSATDATAEPGLRYTYCVTAYADAGAETDPACDDGSRARAVAPVIVVASDGEYENLTRIAWQGASTRVATYNVYRGSDLIATLPALRSSYDDKGGVPSTVYSYCVAAFTADGTESARACDTGSRVLKAPNVSASDDTQEDRVDVTWVDNSGAETGYRVLRAPETNYALTLSGSSADTRLRPTATLQSLSAFTIEFWIKPTSIAADRKLLVRNTGGNLSNGSFLIGFIGNRLYPEVFDVAGGQGFSAGTVPDGQWSHVAVTYRAGGALVGYVNGVEVGRDASVGASFASSITPITFGGFGANVAGDIDELRIWNVERTAAQIAANKDRMLPGGTPGLAGMWSFDAGAGTLAADGAGVSVNGAGNPLIVGTGASWTARTGALPAAASLGETAAGATTFTDRTGASGVRYVYSVAPLDAIGAGAPGQDEGRRVLKAPSGLMVTSAPNETNVTLAFSDNSGAETQQRVVRTGDGTTEMFAIPRNTVTFGDGTVVVGTTYTYRVATENLYGVSTLSDPVTAGTILLPPASVSASDTYTDKVVVTWVDVSNIETGYLVYRDGVQQGGVFPANTTTYTDLAAAPYSNVAGQTYTYSVRAVKGAAQSVAGSDAGVRVGGAVPAPGSVTLSARLTSNDGAGGDSFGSDTDVEGEWAVVGAEYAGGNATGAAYVFRRTRGIWSQVQRLYPPTQNVGSFYGQAVAISGDYIFVGVPNENRNLPGTVEVYQRQDTYWNWIQTLSSGSSLSKNLNMFGHALDASNGWLMVGAYNEQTEYGTGKGQVWAFKLEGGLWKQKLRLHAGSGSGAASYLQFGGSVALDGDLLAVGSGDNNFTGSVYTFTRSGDSWGTAQQVIVSPSASVQTGFSHRLSLKGNRLLVSQLNSGSTTTGGAAYLYERSGATWTLAQSLKAPATAPNDQFGKSVDLSDTRLIVGAPGQGSAFVYRQEGTAWRAVEQLVTSGAATAGGGSVSVDAEAMLMSAPASQAAGSSGAVFTREVSPPVLSVTASDGTYGARVQVRWVANKLTPESYYIYRNGQKIGEAAAESRSFDDFDAPPGDLVTYCVRSYRQVAGESDEVCERGWRPADGAIGGRVATYSAAGFGAGVADVKVCLAPPPNNALLVDGAGGYAVTPVMDLSGSEITIEYWFKGTTFVSGVRQDRTGTGHIDAGAGSSHTVWNASGPLSVAVGTTVANGAWHHVAMTWQQNTTNGMRSYLDGVLVEQKTTGNNPLLNLAAPVYIGAANAAFTNPGEFSKGQFDEVRIWRRARTQAEIQATMRTPLTGNEAGLIAYYTFDQGTGPAGLDLTSGGTHTVLTGGASWTDKAAPVEACALTNADGNFTLSGVRYSTGRTFSVEASLAGHVLQPARQTVTLNAQAPVQNSVAFIDASTYAVAGKVRHNTTSPATGQSYGTCGIPGATLSSPGTQSVTSDDQGDYRFGLVPGQRTITVQRSGLTFAPESYTIDLTADVSGKDFVAGPLRRLIVRTETAGGFAIGTHTLRIRSEDGCYDRTATTDANGNFIDDLPPMKYTVTVTGTVLKTGTGLDQIDVDRYFTGLGAQSIDLTEKADTLAMAYHAPLKIALVTGLPQATGTGAQSCAAPSKLGVATLAQGLFYPLVYSITEDFGALGSFPAENVRLQIVDEIADDTETPVDTTVAYGTVAYQTAVGQPNVLSGRTVNGVDRSYQKSIQVTATVGTRTASRTDWAVVTGSKARNGSFVSFTTEEVPLYVLRDPPGDASYSYLEKGTGYCFTLADWSTSNQLGMVSNFSNMLGAQNLVLTAPLGIGIATEFKTGIGVQGGTNVNMTWRREGNTQVCMEAKERFSTSADPEFVGADADVFIGAAFNMLFAQTDVIKVNGQTCAIEPSTSYGVAPDPTKPVKNTYAYTAKHIRDVLIPQIEALKAAAAPTDTTRYSSYLANWRAHLAYNEALKTAAATVTGPEQRSFSGGADFAASFTSDTTYYHAWSTHMYNESGLGIHQVFQVPALEFNAGWQLKFTRETTFELPGFIGAPPMNGRRSLAERRTTGYVLSDRNTGDSYAVNVRPEKASEVKVFVPAQFDGAAAGGYGAVGGVLSLIGGGLKVVGVYGNLVSYYSAAGAYNGSIFGSIVGTSLNLAFGLAQGAYDLGALLDPENVTSAAVKTTLRVPFGSPIFQTVAGSSSCPWNPDPIVLNGVTQKGTLRRDLPTLAIGKTTLVNADPSKPAVFSLFLGNASESNETRRYVLRSINERNPNGAILKVNGTPIHEGVVFTLQPGKQIETTLTVERGPTRFRYDSLQVILYPECAGLPARISEKEGAVQTFSVGFKSVSSPVVLYTSPRFDLDFGALPDAALGDSLALADFTLETIDYGVAGDPSDDVYLTEIGMEYRPVGTAVWTNAFAATRAQIIAASPQGTAATTYYTRWKPRAADVDGAYEFRAYTRSTGGGPSGAFYYSEVLPGRIDRKGPLVFGTPQPTGEVLALGGDVKVVFDEPVAPASVLADSSVAALSSANLRLVYADGAEAGQRIRVKAVVSGAGVILAPTAGWAGLEGRLLRAELRAGSGIKALTDVLGNPLLAGQTWQFTVRRSTFAWSASTVSAAVTRGVSPHFTVNLANGRTDAVPFTLTGVPAWLTPSIRSGTIAPGAVQPITFVGADTLSGGTHTATFQATIAGGTLPLSVMVAVDATPSWTVTPSQFQHNMSVTAQLFLKGRPSVDASDRVGAFVGGELRGVANVTPRTSSGQSAPDSNRVSMVIYSNAPSGELVTFKVWDAAATTPVFYAVTNRTLAFQADAIAGTPARPVAINAPFVPGTASIALNAGWTWVSFNRVPQGAKVSQVLAPIFGVNPLAGDVFKSQRTFAMYSGTGASASWVGPLADTLLDPRQAYLVRLSGSQELALGGTGSLVDTTAALPLTSGWNWLGFPRSKRQPLTTALAGARFSVAPAADDLVKSQTAFAQFVPGTGWVGSLTELEPGKGYLLKRAAAGTLTYPDAPPVGYASPAITAVATGTAEAGEGAADAEAEAATAAAITASGWTVNPSSYTFNMTMVATLDDPAIAPGALVGAFVGDTCRGVVPLRLVAGSTRPVAFLMGYSNRAAGETLAFRLYDPASGTSRALSPVQAFTPDAVVGTVSSPLVLRTGAATAVETEALPTEFAVLSPSPNPFSSRALLRYALPSVEHVTVEVYDVTGRRVAQLVNEEQAAGRYAVTLDGTSWASGVYVVQVHAGRFNQTVRLMRVR